MCHGSEHVCGHLFITYFYFCSVYKQISTIMADDFDIEAMLEAPYKKVGVLVKYDKLFNLIETSDQPTPCFR